MTRNRALGLGALAVGLLYGLFGGEYTILDWLEMRDRVASERVALVQLRGENDSLRELADALETDPVVQEREARERFGMLRPGEIIYRVVSEPDADSTAARR